MHAGVWGGHLKDDKIHGELAKRYMWPGMRSDIIKWCQACLVCASRQVGRAVFPPLTPIPVSGRFDLTPIPVSGRFDRVGVDVLRFPKSAEGNQYAVVVMDYLTKWPEVFATQDQSALTIAKLFVPELKSIRVHFAPAEIAITLELLSQFLRFLDQNDRHSLGVLLIY